MEKVTKRKRYWATVTCKECNLDFQKNKHNMKGWSGLCKKCADAKLCVPYNEGQLIGECIYIKDVERISVRRRAEFVCRCGNHFESDISHVKDCTTTSCGCVRLERISNLTKTHGLEYLDEYGIWDKMIRRCHQDSCKSYLAYGALGITVCDEWRNSVTKFVEDMGLRPTKKHSLDRIDGTKGYYKENCRWATKEVQANNTKTNVYIEKDGQKLSITQWSRVTGLTFKVIRSRLRNKLPLEYIFMPMQTLSEQKKINKQFKTSFCL